MEKKTRKPVGKIKKRYLKNGNKCKVTFSFPKVAVNGAKVVNLVGDFNDWNIRSTQMKKLKSGEFKLDLNLDKGKEYKFRYLIDGEIWENDWNADKYVPNKFGSDDSVVIV